MMSDCKEMIKLWLSLETNLSDSVVRVCATCLLACDAQVWSTKTVDGYGDRQVGSCCANGLGAMKDGREAWTEGRETDGGWVTLGDID
jgi:hypothetical protein